MERLNNLILYESAFSDETQSGKTIAIFSLEAMTKIFDYLKKNDCYLEDISKDMTPSTCYIEMKVS